MTKAVLQSIGKLGGETSKRRTELLFRGEEIVVPSSARSASRCHPQQAKAGQLGSLCAGSTPQPECIVAAAALSVPGEFAKSVPVNDIVQKQP